MSVASVIARGRRAAEALMVDTFTLTRPTGGMVYDPEAQEEVEATDSLGTTRGKLQSRDLVARTSEVGARTAVSVRMELHLPVSAPALRPGDVVTLTTAGPATTEALVDRVWRVTAPVGKTWATAARYEVEEVVT